MLACSPELAHLTSTALFSSMLHEKLLYQEAHTTIRLLPSAVSKCVLTVHVLRVHMYLYYTRRILYANTGYLVPANTAYERRLLRPGKESLWQPVLTGSYRLFMV